MKHVRASLPIVAALVLVQAISNSASADEASNQRRAREAVQRLNKDIEAASPKFAAAAAADDKKGKSEKSTQDKLNDEHKKARDGGYDKEFHEAIKKDGGERTKE